MDYNELVEWFGKFYPGKQVLPFLLAVSKPNDALGFLSKDHILGRGFDLSFVLLSATQLVEGKFKSTEEATEDNRFELKTYNLKDIKSKSLSLMNVRRHVFKELNLVVEFNDGNKLELNRSMFDDSEEAFGMFVETLLKLSR